LIVDERPEGRSHPCVPTIEDGTTIGAASLAPAALGRRRTGRAAHSGCRIRAHAEIDGHTTPRGKSASAGVDGRCRVGRVARPAVDPVSALLGLGPSLRSPLRENRVSASQRKRRMLAANLR
jgi:hypothetical protein